MIEKLDNYSKAYKIYKLLLNKDHSNILVYGNKIVNKTIIIKSVLTDFFQDQR